MRARAPFGAMCMCEARLERRLIEALVRLDDPSVPIAESYRRSRELAAKLDLPRPSYGCFRVLIHAARRERARRKTNRETLIRVALYLDGAQALQRLESGSHFRS